MSASLSTIRTPLSSRRGGRPPRTGSPSSRKRRAAAAAGALSSTPGGHESIGSGSVGGNSVQSSQLRPTHSFGGMNLFGGFDDDLDNFAQYVDEEEGEEDEDEEPQGEEVSARKASFESDDESEPKPGGLTRLFRSFDKRRKKRNRKAESEPPQQQQQLQQHPQQGYNLQPQSSHNLIPTETNAPPLYIPESRPVISHMKRPQSTLSKNRDPPSLIIPSGNRSRSVPDYRTYNVPKSTLPKIGSFDLNIDTIPYSPDEDIESHTDEDRIILSNPSWKSSTDTVSTALVPYATGGVELIDNASASRRSDAMQVSSLNLQASWDRRLERKDIYHKQYVPSGQELAELQELEEYLGIFSAKTKHRFAVLWRQLVPPLDAVRQRVERRNTLQTQHSTSSMSDLSSVTNFRPQGKSKAASSYSIVLKRGSIQFEEYQDFQCELILLTRGFVVARPNFQFIPRLQAGDMWTSVVQVQPTNPLSITLSCTSRSASSHLTLTQLKQQQQYGCYTYEISCATPQEQAAWLEALRRLVVQAHDAAGTNEKEMGGVGWQYRLVYVPFFTEAVTGNPIQKDKILAGSTGHVDLNAVDSYNSYAPLHYATRANHIRVMTFLLDAGADVHVGDGYGRTPMYYAELHQLPEATIDLLAANGAQRPKKPITAAVAREVWQKRNWRRMLFIAFMMLLLLCCAAAAVMWKFGVLEPIGIGGNKSDKLSLPDNTPTSQPSPSTAQPPVPPLVSRDITTPHPTVSMAHYVKTPIPTTYTNSRNTPGVPTSAPSLPPTPAAFNSALFQLLESASFDAGDALRVSGSPQNLAFLWLLGNANLDSYTNFKKIQRYSLATFYYNTNGDNWAEKLWWLTDEDECSWFNKQVAAGYPACEIGTSSSAQKTITSLDLSFNQLQGTLPPELGLLEGLLRLDLDMNVLTGPIPTELGYLNLIESFSARGNQLSGSVPPELGNWNLVRGLDVSFNKLTGGVPASFSSMNWLTEFSMEMNDLSGFLPPAELGKLTNLFKLALGGNRLEGPIPSEIGRLNKLRYLYLEANEFSSLPTEVGLLENLNVFSAFENQLNGPIPSQLGGLTNCGSILLRSNAFDSVIPSELGLMGQLETTLDLSFNNLSGPIPSELGKLTLLKSLYLQSNHFSGALPNEVSQLSELNTLRIEANDLLGAVPASLCLVFSSTHPNFYADCNSEVSCSCCTYCCTDGVGGEGGGCTCQYANTEQAYLC